MSPRKYLATLAASLALSAAPPNLNAADVAITHATSGIPAVLLTVNKAVQQGDVPVLAHLYRTSSDPVDHVLAAMALERIHFNLEKSSEDARICERSLIDSRPRIAFFCARFANGNLRLSAGSKQADAAELDIARRFEGRIPHAELEHLRHYAASRSGMPQIQVDRPSGSFRIAVQRNRATRMLPSIEVASHGTTARLIVDTGSAFITLDADSAKQLGVRMLDRAGTTQGFMSRNIPVRYGVLDKLTIGGVTVTNAPVEVLAGQKKLIGIDLLRHLGAFRLGEQSIEVFGENQPRPQCRQPMLVASDVWGNALRTLTALSIDGALQTTLIDSGSSFYLTGDEDAAGQLHTRHNSRLSLRDMGKTRHAARVSRATADVDISGRAFEITFKVFKDTRLPWHYVLGSGALRQMDFYFDFNARHTCLLLHDDLH